MDYTPAFINYCREVMTEDGFRIFMSFLGVDEEAIYFNLLKRDSVTEDLPQDD